MIKVYFIWISGEELFTDLTNLIDLCVSENRLISIHPKALQTVERLELSYNKLEHIPRYGTPQTRPYGVIFQNITESRK